MVKCNESPKAIDAEDEKNQFEDIKFEVVLTDEALFSFAAIQSERLFNRIENDLSLLETTPYIGRVYDPAYEAAALPVVCCVFHCETVGIYYLVDESEQRVCIIAIEDDRRDPRARFSSIEYGSIRLGPSAGE